MVCEGGEILLTCSTNVSILSWISTLLQNEQGQVLIFMRSTAYMDKSQQMSTLTVNSGNLFLTSQEFPINMSYPSMVSRLVIGPVSVDLSGTTVNNSL